MKHVNACDVLPEKLVREIQEYVSGYIYVPCTREFYVCRRREIARMRAEGMSSGAIAHELHLSARRVRQILAERPKRK
ncbi:MAG: hypothetical protein ACYS9X_02185 [Planctomycetota bacterium]|jgi:DNA-binding NarL/FixJ family response regulator